MKTTYRRDDFKKRFVASAPQKRVGVLIVLFVLVIIMLFVPFVRGVISRGLYVIAPPLWTFGAAVGESWDSWWGLISSKQTLISENNTLREELSRMEVLVLDRNALAEEVTRLEETLGRPGSDNRVLGRVLAGPGWSPYDTFIIDVGAEHGIAVADVVVYAGAGTIGEIVEVYPESSKVKLYSSPGEENAVLVGERLAPAVARGRGMGNFIVDVSRGSVVASGDRVVLVKGKLTLGIVGLVEEKSAEPVIHVYFRTPFNLANVHSLEVLVKK
ncbi:MAG: hypothetical protein UY07_C0052G0004 [Parcubacteria group bacterium GW2011_GWA1_47_8]|nr:MAG: hypothetical protein UY07_C0052G0004 [Parcubacteria group bacterium GW2011_GWA1_47_8]KKW07305.1 MAG: hypothetical protein UY42_C0014G0004 [Parcubacteria group bacterium GW2011_GWA2_49_16]